MNHFNPPTHRMRSLGLMRSSFSGIPNRGVHLLNRSLHSFLQLNAASQHCQPLIGLAPGQSNRRYCLPGPLLQGYDVSLDVAGRALRLAGQRPHLICHHSKTAPCLPCPCSLNRRIKGQKIGLLGDAVNDRQYHFNLLTLLCQTLNDLGSSPNLPGQRLDQAADLCRGAGIFISGLTNILHLPERCLHRLTFRLRRIGHGR